MGIETTDQSERCLEAGCAETSLGMADGAEGGPEDLPLVPGLGISSVKGGALVEAREGRRV